MGTFIGIEAGGTKIVCGTGTGPDDLGSLHRIPTTTPSETLGAIADYIVFQRSDAQIEGIGIASFGPVDLDQRRATYGCLTTTPKPGWAGVDLLSPIREVFDGPVSLDTDVNGAGLAELRWGAGQGLESLVYVTVGTGIGVGVIVDGRPIHGLTHPEAGHLLVRRHPEDRFAGRCPSHGDCLEGLAAGPAWMDRWGRPSDELDPETLRVAVDIQASYLAQLVVTLVLVASPHRVIMGGGVMHQSGLLPAVRRTASALLNGYVAVPELGDLIDQYLVAPRLGDRAGVLGAIALASQRH